MIKFVYCVRKRAELSDEEFRDYWLNKHGPFVKQFAKEIRALRYVQSHTLPGPLTDAVTQVRGSLPPYDGLTELWFESVEDVLAVIGTEEGQQANVTLAQDEAQFVDLSQSCVFFTEEHTIFE